MEIYLKPAEAVTIMLGLDIGKKGEEKNKALVKPMGKCVAVEDVHLFALASGVDPIAALGYCSLAWCLLETHTLFITKSYKNVGTKTSAMVFLWVLSIVCAARFLL
jgi:hypothetical protein